jgi:hypothetical protein
LNLKRKSIISKASICFVQMYNFELLQQRKDLLANTLEN